MKTSKQFVLLALAGIVALGTAATTVLAAGDDLVTLCYRNRTIQVPSYLLTRYLAVVGTTPGQCNPTPVGQ
jgi:hypothetical protein